MVIFSFHKRYEPPSEAELKVLILSKENGLDLTFVVLMFDVATKKCKVEINELYRSKPQQTTNHQLSKFRPD